MLWEVETKDTPGARFQIRGFFRLKERGYSEPMGE